MVGAVVCVIVTGLTETCAGSFVSLPNNMSMLGTVGPPVPNIDVRLESVPEMGYDAISSTPRGEVCIRGNTLFSGYYKREDLTKEVMIDGWFHTGLIWMPLQNNSFYYSNRFVGQSNILLITENFAKFDQNEPQSFKLKTYRIKIK